MDKTSTSLIMKLMKYCGEDVYFMDLVKYLSKVIRRDRAGRGRAGCGRAGLVCIDRNDKEVMYIMF